MANYEDVLDDPLIAPTKRGWRSFIWRHLPALITALLVAVRIPMIADTCSD
jgi:hypothetical protein